MGDGILFDIEDPGQPRVIDRVQHDVNFAFWHSATFSQKANKVVFADELGGGSTTGAPTPARGCAVQELNVQTQPNYFDDSADPADFDD